MRPRWQEWVIRTAIIALAIIGVWTIWGQELRGVLGADVRSETPTPESVPAASVR